MATSSEHKILLGEAGEQLVLSRLLRLGFIASQAPRTWRSDDIYLSNGISLQVKTTVKKRNWMVGKVEVQEHRFYALVDYSDPFVPTVFVMPSKDIFAASEALHIAVQSKAKTPNFGLAIRNIQDPWIPTDAPPEYLPGWLEERYLEAWHLLGAGKVR